MSATAVLYRPRGRVRLILGPEVIAALLGHTQHAPDAPEAGGVLIGWQVGHDIFITEATTPFPDDVAGLTEFSRVSEGHLSAIVQAWEQSDGLASFWGDWHTHPEGRPEPSSQDIETWKRQTARWTDVDHLFYIIVGTAEVRAWEMDRATLALTELTWEST